MTTDGRGRLGRLFASVLAARGWIVALSILWLGAGAATWFSLRRDLFPDLALPSLTVLVQGPGRSATELELTVAQPLEQAFGGLPGLRRVVSTVQPEVVQVVVAFESGTDPWRARQLVGERLAPVTPSFPHGTAAPVVTSAAGRLQEVLEIVLEGPAVDPMRLRDHTEKVLVPRLQSVPGVARAERLGGEERQLQVTLIPEKARLLGVELAAVVEALEGSEREPAAGLLEIQDKGFFVTVASLAATPEEVRRLPLRTARGLVLLGDVAEVREGPGFRRGLSRHQGHEDVSIRIVKQPSADTLSVSSGVRAALAELRAGLPDGMALTLMYDQGDLVRHALDGVTLALLTGGLFVAVVLVVLLGSVRAAAIVLAVLPLATLGAAVPLTLAGLGLNAMTLGGLAIAVGLLVDAGVIMVENLAHRLKDRPDRPRREVIASAAAEVAVPILTAVLVILAVFVPLLAVGGVAGRLYAPLTVAVASAMTISLVLGFTLVPVLTDRFLPAGEALAEPRLVTRLKAGYRPVLEAALRRGLLVPGVFLAATALAVALAARLGSDFLPKLNEGALMLNSSLPSDLSLAAVDEANERLERELREIPGVATVYRRTGRGDVTEDPMPHNLSDVLVVVSPGANEREMEARAVRVAEEMPFPVEVTTPMRMRIAEGIGGTPADIQVKVFGSDLPALEAASAAVAARISKLPGVLSAVPDARGPLPTWRAVPDDDALRRLGVPRQLIVDALRAALQGLPAGVRFDGPQRVERVVRFPSDGRLSPESLKRIPLVLPDGRVVDLGQVARIEEGSAPSVIRRENGRRRVALNVTTAGDLGGTAARIEGAIAGMELPRGVSVGLGGQVEEARETRRRLLLATAVAGVLVVGLLFLALGGAREVGVVLATLPSAFAGGLFALWLAGETWNVSSIVGLIGLFGVAVQNSLVLISQTKGLLREGRPFPVALREACVGRVRPKLMTAGCAILGLLPMLLGFGGSELERPLAVVMMGGLVSSTLFTLLALPSFYAWATRPRGTREE